MDKKRPVDDVKGFEDFIDGENDKSFMGKSSGSQKKDINYENFTFLTNDAERLSRLKNLLTEKLPFASRFEQGNQILKDQKAEVQELKNRIFLTSDQEGSPYRKSMGEIFDSFFKQSER